MMGNTIRQLVMFALVDVALVLAYVLVAISLPFVQIKRLIMRHKDQ